MSRKKYKIDLDIIFLGWVSFLDKVLFARHLALMIKVGLPLRESIATIQEQTQNKKFKKILGDVLKNIDNGKSLADSLAQHSKIFGSFYINIIRAGEESGTLEENLKYLASHLEKNHELKRKVRTIMIYPSIVLITAIFLSAVIIFFVLPKITVIFKSFQIQLPLTTRILIGFTDIAKNYGVLILFGVIAMLIILFLLARIRSVKFIIHKIILKIPLIGPIVKNFNLSLFSRTLGILLRSGLPIVSAFEITQETLKNLVYQKELEKTANEIKKGKTISDYLKKKERLFTPMASRMIGVGEKTGKLEETLLYLGNFYETEVDNSTKNFSVILEPLLILLIGLAVVFIALAVITPMYEITKGLHF